MVPDFKFIREWDVNKRCVIEMYGRQYTVYHYYIGNSLYFKAVEKTDSMLCDVIVMKKFTSVLQTIDRQWRPK